MHQAPSTVSVYLFAAVKEINRCFDDDNYAKEHPDLVAAFIQSSAIDFATAIIAQRLDALCDAATAFRRDDD
jgi:hypothetical protein